MHWGSSNRSLSRYSTDGRGSAVCQCRDEQRQQETSTRSLPTMPSSSDLSNRGAAFHVSRGGSCSSSKGRLISRPLHTCRVELGGAAADTHRRRETKLTPKRWGGNQTDGLRFAGRVFLWVPRSTANRMSGDRWNESNGAEAAWTLMWKSSIERFYLHSETEKSSILIKWLWFNNVLMNLIYQLWLIKLKKWKKSLLQIELWSLSNNEKLCSIWILIYNSDVRAFKEMLI